MATHEPSINLFEYLDYRIFLKDWYEFQKKNIRGFSFRSFSLKSGFGSPNFLKRVIDGDRNLTNESLKQVAKGLGLTKQETEFFEKLVRFNQSDNHQEKNLYYEQIIKTQKFTKLKPFEKDQYDFCSAWYHPIVRELVTCQDFDGTPEWLAKTLRPSIPPPLAKKSLELLERLNFIRKTKNGKWEQTESVVTTGPEATAVVTLNYHRNVLDLVKHQMTRIGPKERDVSVLNLGVKKGTLTLIKKRVQEFRQEILKMVADDTEPDNVILLAMQLLPVSYARVEVSKCRSVEEKNP